MVVKKKKQNLLEKMGINVMDAQNIQEKLEELRKTLESEMVKNVEQLTAEQRKLFDPIREELDNYESISDFTALIISSSPPLRKYLLSIISFLLKPTSSKT